MKSQGTSKAGEKIEHEDCECHQLINGRVTCLMSCIKCSGAKEVVTTETDGYKKIEITF